MVGFAAEANPDVEAKAEKGEFALRGFDAGVDGAVRVEVEEKGEADEGGVALVVYVSGFFAKGIELARKGEAEKDDFVFGF